MPPTVVPCAPVACLLLNPGVSLLPPPKPNLPATQLTASDMSLNAPSAFSIAGPNPSFSATHFTRELPLVYIRFHDSSADFFTLSQVRSSLAFFAIVSYSCGAKSRDIKPVPKVDSQPLAVSALLFTDSYLSPIQVPKDLHHTSAVFSLASADSPAAAGAPVVTAVPLVGPTKAP